MFTNLIQNKKLLLVLIFILFLSLRLPGLDIQYHQDEYKWVGLVNPEAVTPGSIPHPPLTELFFKFAAKVFGYNNFRYLPFLASIVVFFLLFGLIKRKVGEAEALWSVFFLAISYYNVWASLLVDTDGQILPAFFLAGLWCFYKWDESSGRDKLQWGLLLGVVLTAGFLTKLSFILAVGAMGIEFIWLHRKDLADKNFLLHYGSLTVIFGMWLVLALLNARIIYPPFDIALILKYSGHFAVAEGRNVLQVTIQFVKGLLYLSPLYVFSIFMLSKEQARKLQPFLLYIVLGLVFYLLLFDFSSGALDRYFVFLIVPASVITGTVTARIFKEGRGKKPVVVGLICAGILFVLQFLPHYVPALYPKPEWFYRVFDLKWNFVMPFFGGSGPLGFYVSWLLIGFSWVLSGLFVFWTKIKKGSAAFLAIPVLVVGLLYNSVFTEEYLFGKINGSSEELLENIQNFVVQNDKIKEAITYNDIGAYVLRNKGKYRRRLYVAPKFEGSYQDVLNNFKSYYMVLEIPKINPESIYAEYFATCEIIYEEWSGVIPARVYNCEKAENI